MTARVFVVAQARMGSSRLPGKVLRHAGANTLLAHLAARLRRCETPTATIVATTTDPGDDLLVDAARALGLDCFRGSIDDVLSRYVGALASVGATDDDIAVRVTGDCPLLDPSELDRLVREFVARRELPDPLDHLDYLTNQAGETRRIPRGLDVEVMTVGVLRRADREARSAGEREHVTPYLYTHPGRFRTAVSDPPGPDLGHLRLTVDTPADLELVDAIVCALGPDATTASIAGWLAAHPEVAKLNASVQQKSIAGDTDQRVAKLAGRTLVARADAGATTGYGHVTRVGALLDAWTELGGRAILVGVGIEGSARARLEAHAVEVVDGGDEAFEARLADADAIAVDGYAFDRDRQARWRRHATLLCIDDLAVGEQVADVVVNQILDFPAERYELADYTRLLLGPAYVLLRREYRDAAAADSTNDLRIVVTFGGSDPAGLSRPLTRALLDVLPPEWRVTLIVGSGVDDAARVAIETLASDDGRLEILHDVRDMASVLRGARLCVTAAGTTVWEAMACGVPIAAVAVADNQLPVLAGIEQRHAGLSLGWHADLDHADAAARISRLLADEPTRESLARRGRALIDARGVYRVLDTLLERMPGRQGQP